VDLVEVVLLRDDVQNLGGVLAVVGGVPLAYILDPNEKCQKRCNHNQTTADTTTTTPPLPPSCSLEHSDHPVRAVVHVFEVPATANHTAPTTAQGHGRSTMQRIRTFQ
jgi:hypothetical protein